MGCVAMADEYALDVDRCLASSSNGWHARAGRTKPTPFRRESRSQGSRRQGLNLRPSGNYPQAHVKAVFSGIHDLETRGREEPCRPHPDLTRTETICQALPAWKAFDFHYAFRREIRQSQSHRLMHEALTTMSFDNAKTNEGVNEVDRFQFKGGAQLRPCRPRPYSAPGDGAILQVENPTVVRPGIPELSAQALILLLATILPCVPTRGFPGHTPAPVMRRRDQQRRKILHGIRSQALTGQRSCVHVLNYTHLYPLVNRTIICVPSTQRSADIRFVAASALVAAKAICSVRKV